MSRWVVVDDTDSGITYTGQWFLDQGTQNSIGNFGPPYLSTLHGTNSVSSLSYSFHGTMVIITGTNQFSNPSGVTWQCIVDGVSVPSVNVSVAENRLLFCEKEGLSDGPHVITVNVTVSNQQTFWFDYIGYLPSPSVSLAQASLSIATDDSKLQYGAGWTPIFPGNMTGQTGSTFSFEFDGISLIWLGFYINSLPTASTTATYAIDGQSPITFNLNGASSEGTGVQYNQIFFQTGQLSSGSHTLGVVYQGNSATTPLTLSALYVQNNASSLSPSSGTPAASSTVSLSQSSISSSSGQATFGFSTISSSDTSSAISGISTNGSSNASFDTTNGPRNLGSIIGGVIGGLGLLILAVLAILFLRQRNSRSKKADIIVEPFLGPSMTIPPLLTQHSSPDNLFPNPQYTSDNANTTSSLSPLSLTPNHLIQVNNSTPLLTTVLREQRKGEVLSSRIPQLRQTTRAADLSSSSITGYNFQPTRVVQDEDAGNQLAQTDQHGHFVELLPPAYSF